MGDTLRPVYELIVDADEIVTNGRLAAGYCDGDRERFETERVRGRPLVEWVGELPGVEPPDADAPLLRWRDDTDPEEDPNHG